MLDVKSELVGETVDGDLVGEPVVAAVVDKNIGSVGVGERIKVVGSVKPVEAGEVAGKAAKEAVEKPAKEFELIECAGLVAVAEVVEAAAATEVAVI